MNMTKWFPALLFAMVLSILLVGCKRASTPNDAPVAQPTRPKWSDPGAAQAAHQAAQQTAPQLPSVKVQLSDPTAEVVLEVVKNRHMFTAHCKVKYRFVEGAPQAGMWYNFEAEMKDVGVAIKPLEGSTMKAEGELEKTVPLLPVSDLAELKKANVEVDLLPDVVHKEVVFQIQQGTAKNGPFRSIGDKVRCPLKTKPAYPIP